MAAFAAPPGHPAHNQIMALCALVDAPVAIKAPDAGLKEPTLTTPDGARITGTADIARHVASIGRDAAAAATLAADDDATATTTKTLYALAADLERLSASWTVASATAAADDARRAADRAGAEARLAELEAAAPSPSAPLTLAGLACAGATLPLFSGVIGAEERASKYPATVAWLEGCLASNPALAQAYGASAGLKLCPEAAGWSLSAAAGAGKKKKKGGGAGASAGGGGDNGGGDNAGDANAADSNSNQQQPAKAIDPEKAAKLAAKKAEKEARRARALEKERLAKEGGGDGGGGDTARPASGAGAAAAAGGGNEKEAGKKDEAEAKKAAEAAEVAALIEQASATPKGAKKAVERGKMFRAYHPRLVEAAWYEWWEGCGMFKPLTGKAAEGKRPFVIVIPPPNVTGALHIGHALTNAVQDTIVRWRRMQGYNALWVPGTDHAGIATQTVVEKKLAREGKTRHDLGRDAFLQEVHKWVDEYGGRICGQLRRMGSSVDWSRQVFTMDAPRSAAVLEAFVRLHSAGQVYRDNRLVNWDCTLRTAVSDIEVDYVELTGRTPVSVPGYKKPVEFGALTSFAYPLEDGSGEIVVATTRPETMLGDTAVAVHPDDDRYKHLIGKHVVHPFCSGRRLPIIADAELVDPSFGTGAVKITPAHDPNDFLVGKRHGLAFVNVLDDTGCINQAQGGERFGGMPRFEARVAVVDALKELELFRGVADNPMRLGLSSRSKDVIEPVLKPQWWVACGRMAAAAGEAARSGDLEIIPREQEATWHRWMDGIRDWCVSRQLWWGHRIPAWYVTFEEGSGEGEAEDKDHAGAPGGPSEDMTRWVVARDETEARALAEKRYHGRKGLHLRQDEDVLDTWFSSGLFPFSVLGWPDEQSADFQHFYPTSLLETGHDILFFWVARMVMMGLQLTGKCPFKQVYLHAMVRDAHGRKMSKSLGNVIDPLHVVEGITLSDLHATLEGGNLDPKEVAKAKQGQQQDFPEGIEECGTDALRFALVAYTAQGRDINLDIKRVVGYRHWCNKLWNAIRFAALNLPDDFRPAAPPLVLDKAVAPAAGRWLLSRLNAAARDVTAAMELYDFSTATQRLYGFWQYEMCDVFIELMKPIMYSGGGGQGQGASEGGAVAAAATDDASAAAAAPAAAYSEAAKEATRQALFAGLEAALRLLHPFMPFVTEELWQALPRRPDMAGVDSIMLAPYPEPTAGWTDEALEADFAGMQAVVAAARKLRADYGLTPKQKPPVFITVAAGQQARRAALQALAAEAAALAPASAATVLAEGEAPPAGCGVAIVDDAVSVAVLLKGVLDPAAEVGKLQKKRDDAALKAQQLKARTSLASYLERTPEGVRRDDADKLARLEAEAAAAEAAIEQMQQLAL